eukprot:TRINITY_DN65739_c8_g1_i1.p1 TRINITY_DN65739_c8_g1~~TRINITY_DN65739_c8_g1_i1.p1  ORF type:complete len:488 (+),score=42.73 TRINITY_DN65739_c8_g1_i1:32-1465(+)
MSNPTPQTNVSTKISHEEKSDGSIVTGTAVRRFLPLAGNLFCRVYQGDRTIPRTTDYDTAAFATRSFLKMINLRAVRRRGKSAEDAMVGPCDYFGNLPRPDQHSYTICFPSEGGEDDGAVPYYVQHPLDAATHVERQPVPHDCVVVVPYLWTSGAPKSKQLQDKKQEFKQCNASWPSASLFPNPGVIEVDAETIKLPRFDARNVDLSPFKAQLVPNDSPFVIPSQRSDDYSVVSYLYGPGYAENHAMKNDGLFIEHHNFAQALTPMHPDASGFTVLAREPTATTDNNNNTDHTQTSFLNAKEGKFELIGIEIPFGYTLIIEKGALHGDATIKGLFMMAMTANHRLMGTADAVFWKNRKTKENVGMVLQDMQTKADVTSECVLQDFGSFSEHTQETSEDEAVAEQRLVSYRSTDFSEDHTMKIPPHLVPVIETDDQHVSDMITRIQQTDKPAGVFAKVVFNPFSKAWWSYATSSSKKT